MVRRVCSFLSACLWILLVGTMAASAAGQCTDGTCCIEAECCHVDLQRRCQEQDVCSCYFKCPRNGGGGGSCGCRCEPGTQGSSRSRPGEFDLDPAIATDAIGIKVCGDGTELAVVARRLEELTLWQVGVAPSISANRARGDWRGELLDVADRIAAAYGVFVKVDLPHRAFHFVPDPR